jgi:beta-lactam-binding protein with PASTA domain
VSRTKSILKSLAKQAALAASLLAVAASSALFTMRVVLSSDAVTVPNLLGKTLPDAGGLAHASRLSIRLEGRRTDDSIPVDRIVAQDPAVGAALKARRNIRVWTSLGVSRVPVPNVETLGVRTARITLEQAQFPVARIIEVPDSASEGTVLVQRPPPASSVPGPVEAGLLVSRGAGGWDYVMPDLIARNADTVIETLRRAGLKVTEVRYRNYPGVAPGVIIRQIPPSGHRISRRDAISLDVVRAPSETP